MALHGSLQTLGTPLAIINNKDFTMDTNSIISLNNVIPPEPTQVTADADYMVEEFSSDFSQALELAQIETEQFESQQEPLEAPSSVQTDQQEPDIENEAVPEEQIQIAPTEPSDNNQDEQPTGQVSEQNAQGTEPQSVRNALEKTQHISEKENFDQMVEKIPHWSNSIILAHAGITRQPPPGKAEVIQQPVVSTENSTEDLTTVVSEQRTPLEAQIQINITPDISLTAQTSETGNSLVASSENAQLVALATENTQAEQIQNQPLSAQDVISQPNVADQIIPALQNEQIENIQQQPVAQVIVDNEQSLQTPHNTQEISIPLELEAQTQQNGLLSVENNVAAVNTDQSLAQQATQESSASVQENLNPSQVIPPQFVSENNTDTADSQTQTQQDANNKLTVDSLVKENGSEQLQITNVQTTNSSVQTVETNTEAAAQQMINTATEQNQGVVTSSLTQETENSEASGLLNTASAAVGRQIQESIQTSFGSNQQQITVNLQPPELGRVTIRFEQQGDDIIGQLEVTKTETRLEITEQLPQIIRNLADAGIQIKKIDVNLADQYEQDNYKEQSPQDMFLTDQQYQSQQQPDSYETPQQLTDAEQLFQADFESQPQEQEHEGSLNMLV
jgi:hypothetical protein